MENSHHVKKMSKSLLTQFIIGHVDDNDCMKQSGEY